MICELEKFKEKTFDDIRHIDEKGNEYWLARVLQQVLNYTEWRKFIGVIEKAMEACKASNNEASHHFVGADKIVRAGATSKTIEDYKLSRYACYLIVQNADSRKKV